MASLIPASDGFEIVGPFMGQTVAVLNGYSIPLITVREIDGGEFSIIVDDRLGYTVPAGEAENVLRLIADVIAVAWGYNAHPSGLNLPWFDDNRHLAFARVPHPTLSPKRMVGIGSVHTAEATPEHDPRDET